MTETATKEYKVQPTRLQKRAAGLFLEEVGKSKKNPKMGKIMLKAGYSKAMAKNPKHLTSSKGWQALLDSIDTEGILKNIERIALQRKGNRDAVSAAKLLLCDLQGLGQDKATRVGIGIFQDVLSLQE